jgi:hypothetical protein
VHPTGDTGGPEGLEAEGSHVVARPWHSAGHVSKLVPMSVTAQKAAEYLAHYVRRYRQEYVRFTTDPPDGGGYPRLRVSPYLDSAHLECHISSDGAVIADYSWTPEYDWAVAGGPALLVDFPETRTPASIVELLKTQGLYGKNIGISRIVAKDGVPPEIWAGQLPKPLASVELVEDATTIRVFEYELVWLDLIQRLTFGAFGLILDIKLPDEGSEFWNPRIVRDVGFATADRMHKRFFHYLELIRHVDSAAWDPRSIWARVHIDVRRDFAWFIGSSGHPGGYIAFNAPAGEVRDYAIPARTGSNVPEQQKRLAAWAKLITDFESLLAERADADESVFHEFLRTNPVLLDLHNQEIFDKPRFTFPPGLASGVGKDYVEPDFVIQYPDRSYRLIELEKPGKQVATVKGEPRKELTQAAFQIAEFRTFIDKHYDLIAAQFPGISSRCSSTVVISRNTEKSFGVGRDKNEYMDLIRGMYADIEFLVYDDLLARARQALMNISRLTSEAPTAS